MALGNAFFLCTVSIKNTCRFLWFSLAVLHVIIQKIFVVLHHILNYFFLNVFDNLNHGRISKIEKIFDDTAPPRKKGFFGGRGGSTGLKANDLGYVSGRHAPIVSSIRDEVWAKIVTLETLPARELFQKFPELLAINHILKFSINRNNTTEFVLQQRWCIVEIFTSK